MFCEYGPLFLTCLLYESMISITHPDKNDICSLHSNVSAGADSNARVCLCQRRGVVDAIPHHGHLVSFRLQLLHLGHLMRGEDLSKHRADANLTRTVECE